MKKLIALIFLSGNAMALCPGYQYQQLLTINASQVSTGTLNYPNFPVLFQDTDVRLSTATSGGHMSTGFDLIFSTNGNGFPLINWDTETWNNTGSTQDNIFLQVPTVSSSTNTTLYMCYGNASITSYQGNSTATWDSNYIAIYHLGPVSAGAATPGIDSSGNRILASVVNVSTESLSGKMDGAGTFIAASTSYMTIGGTTGTPLLLNNAKLPMTIEFWYYPYTINLNPSLESTLFSDQSGTNANKTVSFDGGLALTAKMPTASCGSLQEFGYTGTGSPYALNTWHYFVLTTSGTQSTPILGMSLNGNAPQTFSMAAYPSGSCAGAPMNIASVGSHEFSFDGLIDEFRVSNIARTSDWETTEYNSENSPSTFMSIGPELGGAAGISVQINGTVKLRGRQTIL